MPTPCDSVIRVTLDGKTDAFPVNTTVQTVISRLLDAPAAAAVLGVMQGGVCRELNESLTERLRTHQPDLPGRRRAAYL